MNTGAHRTHSKDKKHHRDNSINNAGSHSKKKKTRKVTGSRPKPKIGLMSNFNTFDLQSKKTDYSNYMCSEVSKKVASRTSGLNKSDYKPSTTKKRCASGIKITGNSRNKSTSFGDSRVEIPGKQSSKASYKYRNLSFYNNQFNEKKMTKQRSNIGIPGMVSNYANHIIAKPILLKKNIKNSKQSKPGKIFEDNRTRNPQSAIFKTNDTVPYQLTNESYMQLKMAEDQSKKRLKKRRSSTSNSQSKSKHNKSTTEYISKPGAKLSMRTGTNLGKGPLYHTFYQRDNKKSKKTGKVSNRSK